MKGHVLALFVACVAGIGALVVTHAQWRLTQRDAATVRWAQRAAEVLARSALERGIADLRAQRALPAGPFALPPGTATVKRTDAGLEGCGTVKARTACLRAELVGDRLGRVTLAPAGSDPQAPQTPR